MSFSGTKLAEEYKNAEFVKFYEISEQTVDLF